MKLKNTFLSLALPFVVAGAVEAGSTYVPPPAPVQTTIVENSYGNYFRVGGGGLWIDDASVGAFDVKFDSGWMASAAYGWNFGNGWAVEVEAGYGQADIDEIDYRIWDLNINGELRQIPVHVNAIYTAQINDAVGFYIGGGVGALWSEIKLDEIGTRDDWNFSAQAKAGVNFTLSQSVDLNLGYRFIWGADAVFAKGYASDDVIAHVGELGITFKF